MTITRRGFCAVLAGAALTTLSLPPPRRPRVNATAALLWEPLPLGPSAFPGPEWPGWAAIEAEFDRLRARTRARQEIVVKLRAFLDDGPDGWRVVPG